MKKNLRWFVLSASTLGLGLSMPSCPNQQVMQQQMDSLQAANADLVKKIQLLNNQVNSLTSDMNEVKQLLPQMTNVIQAEKGSLEQLSAVVKELQKKRKVH